MRSPLRWWLDRRQRRWQQGEARMPTQAELEELRQRLAEREAEGKSLPRPFVQDVHDFLARLERERGEQGR